jgi:hypothetical protein
LRRVNDGSEFAYFLLFGGEEMGRMADAACGLRRGDCRSAEDQGERKDNLRGSGFGRPAELIRCSYYLSSYLFWSLLKGG